MKTKRKIHAFTLSEMIIVLILTSIVVALAFSTLRLVHQHVHVIKGNFTKNTQLNLLKTALWLDFNRYANVEYDALNDQLKFENAIETRTYNFQEDYIIKEVDTFHIKLKSRTFFFDGNVIQEGAVDAFKLETTKALQSQNLFIFKKNDAAQYMK